MPEPTVVDLMDVVAFVRVVETGSIAHAAARLGVAKSIVSRRVSRLEKVLGAVLLTRTSRGTSVTDVGRDYYVRASSGLAELESAQDAVGKSTNEVSGQLRISVPLAFGECYLAPLLAEFATHHPRIQFDVCFEDRLVDVIGEGFDLAMRIGNLPDSGLIARRLAKIRAAVIASPAYLDARGRPTKPADLVAHDIVLYSHGTAQWRFEQPDGWEYVRVTSRFRTDNGQMLLAAARAGLGMAIVPMFMVEKLVAQRELELVLPEFPHEGADLHLLMPPARAGMARVRALVNFLSNKFEQVI